MVDEHNAAKGAEWLAGAAAELVAAEQGGYRIDLLSERLEGLSIDEAYCVARYAFDSKGEQVAGYKLGYTNAAIREQMNIFEPNFGRYGRSDVLSLAEGQPIALDGLVHPRIEPEITIILGRRLCGPDVQAKHVLEAIKTAHMSLEIVDTRYRGYAFTACDNIADNSSSARAVIGGEIDLQLLANSPSVSVSFYCDDEEIDSNVISNVLADMCSNVAWLANRLFTSSEVIEAGAFVMTGALTRAHPITAGKTYRAEIEGIGSIAGQFGRDERK
jgi:2-keto-4-pentenoate hydratase